MEILDEALRAMAEDAIVHDDEPPRISHERSLAWAIRNADPTFDDHEAALRIATRGALLQKEASPVGGSPRSAGRSSVDERLSLARLAAAETEQLLSNDDPRARHGAAQGVRTLAGFIVQQATRTRDPAWVEILCILRERIAAAIASSLTESPAAMTAAATAGSEPSSAATTSPPMHESAGWRGLETSLSCLRELVMLALAQSPSADVDHAVSAAPVIAAALPSGVTILDACTSSRNRFVREAILRLLDATVLMRGVGSSDSDSDSAEGVLTHALVQAVCAGLDDNWSQVRLAASVLLRHMLLAATLSGSEWGEGAPTTASALGSSSVSSSLLSSQRWWRESQLAPFADRLLPRMVFCRYFVADGVQSYALETWKQCLGGQGIEAVIEHLDSIAAYYVEQSHSENHNLRVTACQVIGELGAKLPVTSLGSVSTPLLHAVVDRLYDSRWHVRGVACEALSAWAHGALPSLVSDMPSELVSLIQGALVQILELARDGVPSVREDAAGAVAALCTQLATLLATEASVVIERTREVLESVAVRTKPPTLATEATRAEPPDLDYDSDGGRDDATSPLRSAAAAASPVAVGGVATTLARCWPEAADEVGWPTVEAALRVSKAFLDSFSSLTGPVAASVRSAFVRPELVETLGEIARRSVTAREGFVLLATLQSTASLLEAVGTRGARVSVELLGELLLRATSAADWCPAAAGAARRVAQRLRQMLGETILAVRLTSDAMARLGLSRDSLSDSTDAMSLQSSAAVRMVTAETGSVLRLRGARDDAGEDVHHDHS